MIRRCTHDRARSCDFFGGGARWPLYSDPPELPGVELTGCLLLDNAAMHRAQLTVSYPVHNREGVVGRSLRSLINTTGGTWELVVVIDACSDNSEREVWRILEDEAVAMSRINCRCIRTLANSCLDNHPAPEECQEPVGNLLRVVVLRTTTSFFETAADNLVMSATRPATYYALVQSDTIVSELGWNLKLSAALRAHADLLGVSGRCSVDFLGNQSVGNCAAIEVRPVFVGAAATVSNVHVHDVAVRSPLLLRAAYMQRLGFFDQTRYVLANDDHDLARRARGAHGWRMGYVPLRVHDDRSTMSGNTSVLYMGNRQVSGYQEASTKERERLRDAFAAAKRGSSNIGSNSSNGSTAGRWRAQAESVVRWQEQQHGRSYQPPGWRTFDVTPSASCARQPVPAPPPSGPAIPELVPCEGDERCARKQRHRSNQQTFGKFHHWVGAVAPMPLVAWRELAAQVEEDEQGRWMCPD